MAQWFRGICKDEILGSLHLYSPAGQVKLGKLVVQGGIIGASDRYLYMYLCAHCSKTFLTVFKSQFEGST